MSILAKKSTPQAQKVWFTDTKMYVLLTDGRELGIPLEWFPRLRDASESERMNWRLIGGGIGIHWEDIDEDLSVAGLL
ncbi:MULTISPECIES: DUF2442 domain-containing protein [Pontibacter]|uniref:DUF2442 domain-containing protein n=1 Tax=Pontibacter lucknowensis TaxID=1077936 RepID=A0A1N6UXH5_9BACT|nr:MULTISPECIES: DUF2442 domain-containing protein [Pontibacter]EJF11584.1 hypothetical protein O71_02197 [Pontibacter sp. BAB1700]SIQ70288.1 Protein of unknown function [Pontibacter lucknowensis]